MTTHIPGLEPDAERRAGHRVADRLVWGLYTVLFTVGFALVLPRYLLRMKRRGGYRRNFLQRVGRYAPDVARKLAERRRIWVHAVSVGEMYVAAQFMREYRAVRPGSSFVVTTNTSTGYKLGQTLVTGDDMLLYFPVDVPAVMGSVLDRIRPAAVVLTEGEIWPNLIRLAGDRRIPVAVINARMSDASYRGYRRLRFFTRRTLERLSLVCAQGREDARRFIDGGVPPERVRVLNSAKYDAAAAETGAAGKAQALLRTVWPGGSECVWVGGSTWPGEERLLAGVYGQLKPRFPALRLVIVPRHVERSDEIENELASMGLRVVRRRGLETRAAVEGEPDVLLVDTTGELKSFYAAATVIFVGKSLLSQGGQNIIEPAVFARPILVGPHMENFRAVMQDFQDADAILTVGDADELRRAVERLLGDAPAREALGARTAAVVAAKRGATRETVACVAALCEP